MLEPATTLGNIENKDGVTDYLQAILNARQGNNDAASSYLKSALQKDPSLSTYANNDLEPVKSQQINKAGRMKRLIYIFTLTLVLVACGSRSGYFSLEGRLLNLNQGEFYVYSPDGVFDGVDTIKVEGGRFAFETPCKESGTIMIVFPNFSEQPVFAEPGKSVSIKGDASHLKEIEIDGTAENKLMNGFRQQISKASPPEVLKYAEQFVRHNPRSAVSVYILRKYFINTNLAYESKDLDKAEQLCRHSVQGST